MSNVAKSKQVINFLETFSCYWMCVDGGWGVDALLGEQSRPHADLDLIVRSRDAENIFDELVSRGYELRGERDGIVYSNNGLEIDLHPIRFDENGFGNFDLPNQKTWPFPPAAFQGRGKIDKLEVRCLSVNAQIQCHFQGYKMTSKDCADMNRLQKKFGCVLPLSFYLDDN